MLTVGTHDGSFHADEVFALATLQLAEGELKIVRSRDRDTLAGCDLRVDVGFAFDPAHGDFDHHQRGGAGARDNSVRYASFGLIWRAFGVAACQGDEDAARKLDERLVQGVDANDIGQDLTTTTIDGIRPMSVSGAIAAFLPAWDEERTGLLDERFGQALDWARGVLRREIDSTLAANRAQRLVAGYVAASPDPRIVELEVAMPWHEAVVASAPEALICLYPKSDSWGAQAVPVQPGRFENRIQFPEAWAGLQHDELATITGVADARFCHVARFLAVAESRDGARRLAQLAIEAAYASLHGEPV